MRTPLTNRDPADEQTTLFDDPPACPTCRTTRKNLCRFDADVSEGIVDPWGKRPSKCLAAYDPNTATIPY